MNFDYLLRDCTSKAWEPGSGEKENNQERIELSCKRKGPQ